MDVRTKNCGRPHQKVRFPAAPVVERTFLTRGHPGLRVRNVRRRSGPETQKLHACVAFSIPDSVGFLRTTEFVSVAMHADSRIEKKFEIVFDVVFAIANAKL